MFDSVRLERVRYVTAHFEILQGLTALPAISWMGLAMGWAAGRVSGWLFLAATLAAPVAMAAAVTHYRRRYGQVRPRPGKTHDTFLLWPVVALFTAVGLVSALGPSLPISVEGLLLSGGALAGAWFQRPLAPAFLFTGLVGAALSLAPLGGAAGPHPLSEPENWIMASCVGSAVLAVWSHLVLRRTFAAPDRHR